MLTKLEKKKLIIELYKQQKTYREIAKEAHVSLNDISHIIKEHTGEIEEQPNSKVVSKSTQAFKLFELGKGPLEVAIELDLVEEEVTKFYKDYWKLKGLYDLNQTYEEAKDEIFISVKLCKYAKSQGMDLHQLVNALEKVKELPFKESQCQNLTNDIYTLQAQKYKAQNDLNYLYGQINSAKQELYSYDMQIKSKGEELAFMKNNKRQLESLIERLKKNNSEEYLKQVKITAEKTIEDILTDKKNLLLAAVASVLEALRKQPEKQLILLDNLQNCNISYPMVFSSLLPAFGTNDIQQQFRKSCEVILLELAEKLYAELLERSMISTLASSGALI